MFSLEATGHTNLVTITSGQGMGKSQFIREIEYDLLKRCDGNIGVLALEEDLSRTTLGIMSVAANRPLHLEEDTPVDDLRPFWEDNTWHRAVLPVRPLGFYFCRQPSGTCALHG